MIDLLLNLDTQTARLASPVVFKAGAPVVVRITTHRDPGSVPAFELSLSPTSTPPAVLAYYDDAMAEDSATVYLAEWDTNDVRLVEFLEGKDNVELNLELAYTLGDSRYVCANLKATAQQRNFDGPEASEGGPSYYTTTQSDARYAAASELPKKSDLLPTAWSGYATGGRYVYLGSGGDFPIVDSVKTDITIANSGAGTLTLYDAAYDSSLEIAPGETVNFYTVDLGGGSFALIQTRRYTPSDYTKLPLAGGTLAGLTQLTGQPGQNGVAGTPQPADAATVGHVTLAAFSQQRIIIPLENWTVTTANGGSASSTNGGRLLSVGNTINSTVIQRTPASGVAAFNDGAINTILWNKTRAVNFNIQCVSFHASAIYRVLIGADVYSTTLADLTVRGIGIRVSGGRLWLLAHNGTTPIAHDTGWDIWNGGYTGARHVSLRSYVGTVEVWVDGVLRGTTTGGPTSGSGNQCGINISAEISTANFGGVILSPLTIILP